jgi:hypothetical protein
MIPEIKDFYIIFWLLYIISTIVILSIIITKKFMFNNIYNQPLPGDKGDIGNIGKSGISYKLETYPDKCYGELINAIEDYLIINKQNNDLDYNPDEPQLKNLYFKNLLKRICMSEEFGNYIYSDTHSDVCEYDEIQKKRLIKGTSRECDKSSTDNKKSRYDHIVSELKNIIINNNYSWIKTILKNREIENKKLYSKLGYDESDYTADNLTNIVDINIIEEYKYNNKKGHQFFNDYFYTDKFFKDVKTNPFADIKNLKKFNIVLNSYNVVNNNPYYWGTNLNRPTTKCTFPKK